MLTDDLNGTNEEILLSRGQQSLALHKQTELQKSIEMYLASIRQKKFDITNKASGLQ